MSFSRLSAAVAGLLFVVACSKAGTDDAAKTATPNLASPIAAPAATPQTATAPDSATRLPVLAQHIQNREWTLVSIGASSTADGLASSGITLHLDSASSKANGFGGCNNYSGHYTQHADSLKFGAMVSTKMACAEPTASSIEMIYLATLADVIGYRVDRTGLALYGTNGIVARYVSKP